MNAAEANVFLTRLRMLDPRFYWPNAEAQADAAEAWAAVLHDVALDAAVAAAVAHYRESSLRLMPADVVARCPAVGTVDVAARERAEWLASRGLTEADVARMSRPELERLVTRGSGR